MKPISIVFYFFAVFFASLTAIYVYHHLLEVEDEPAIVVNSPTAPAIEPKLEAKPVVPAGPPSTYDEALAQAKQSQKKVLLMLSGSRCMPCRMMKERTLKNARVQQIIADNFILFVTEDNADLNTKFKVVGVPTYRILDGDGNILDKATGYMDAREFSTFLEKQTSGGWGKPGILQRLFGRRKAQVIYLAPWIQATP